jgi:serine/threonine protein kinase
MSVGPKDLESAFPEFSVDHQPLGTGGFKVAHQVEVDGISFVLKVVKQPIDDPDAALPERLRRKIEAMRNVNSPRVVRIERGPEIREVGAEQHVWYLEPFYDGGTLDAWLGTPMAIDEVMTLTFGLLEAVEALWNQGRLVHRDIKPANIAFDDERLPVLLDLGIALHENLTPITQDFGFSPRTPAYAAPEQFEVRRLARIDFRRTCS